MGRLKKLLQLAGRPGSWAALGKTRTAAAVEHLPLLQWVRPDTLIDVGANKGQFTLAAQLAVPNVKVIAFEPLPSEAAMFRRNFDGDTRVRLLPLALAATQGRVTLHVTDRPDSSSLLALGSAAREAYGLKPQQAIEVEQQRLDAVISAEDLVGTSLLKIDVQGAEAMVIDGAAGLLPSIDFVYVELSFVPLYANQPLAGDIIAQLTKAGFVLRGVQNLSATRAFGPTQADFLFENARRGRG
ncbi:MAG: FkbM family methyltransferase [Candidatus Methylacidiphilales bacterium]|nr:FkbM family methyltransferase [Candidatus Methylacidiphilales bacterium]